MIVEINILNFTAWVAGKMTTISNSVISIIGKGWQILQGLVTLYVKVTFTAVDDKLDIDFLE